MIKKMPPPRYTTFVFEGNRRKLTAMAGAVGKLTSDASKTKERLSANRRNLTNYVDEDHEYIAANRVLEDAFEQVAKQLAPAIDILSEAMLKFEEALGKYQ